jgi:hypothetical protein
MTKYSRKKALRHETSQLANRLAGLLGFKPWQIHKQWKDRGGMPQSFTSNNCSHGLRRTSQTDDCNRQKRLLEECRAQYKINFATPIGCNPERSSICLLRTEVQGKFRDGIIGS